MDALIGEPVQEFAFQPFTRQVDQAAVDTDMLPVDPLPVMGRVAPVTHHPPIVTDPAGG